MENGQRVLRFLASGPASLRPAAAGGRLLLEAEERGAIAIEEHVLEKMVGQGVVVRASHSVALSGTGAALARRLASSMAGQGGRDLQLVTVEGGAGPAAALANLSESPLAQLMRRKGRDGRPFLAIREFEAGERLRADYTRGQIMPRLGANWVASVASGRRADGGGMAELTDAALGARRRVDKAIEAVGPELAGVLVDVCCFLKGLEQVEMERGWPVRSPKIVLKTALGVLARHYFPQENSARRAKPLHWGAEDYRPSIC
ncbi:DUF6456 domain-containing protein [Mesorhizobium sp. SP-1A]|uniref:DUF6456 domain-containing protein n=1 Tax=Mesorhizobium sp. SP-1A TaxID=3077840 RepID=UPI0028F6E4AA|nr:DUF6456 domain-containing protein [Mesorhizobium sp. SP-1A]